MQDTKQQTSGAKITDQGNADTSRELKRRKLNEAPSSERQQVRAYKGASEDENDATLSSDVDAETSSSDSGQDQSTVGEENDGESSHLLDPDPSSEDPAREAATISFGALARAQEFLGKRKNPVIKRQHTDEALQRNTSREDIDAEALERRAGKKDTRDFNRSSKHAPVELSSKKAVSRKRDVIPVHKPTIRDPRFEPISGPLDEAKIKNKYAFLDTYRDAEIAELKAGIRKTKDATARETLKRALISMESRKKARLLSEQQQEFLRRHRKEEKEKVDMGKKPYYLKRGELKERALVERFKGMKGKQVDKVIERRRKKQTARERKAMPEERRG